MQLHLHPQPLNDIFYCLQYSRCIQLLEKLVAMPCYEIEDDYVQKFRKQLPVQSKKQNIEPLQYDEQGLAFSAAEGNFMFLFFLCRERGSSW